MSEESKSLEENNDDMEEFEGLGEKLKIFSMMRNMINRQSKTMKKVEIFDDSSNRIYPTIWYSESQTFTCRKCGKTSESVPKRRLGLGNVFCFFCFSVICLLPCIPCMCFAVCDVHHFCPNCSERVGVKTFI